MSVEKIHTPVLLAEILTAFGENLHGHFLDGTVGLGGHAKAILTSGPHCQYCGLDRDAEALHLAEQRLAPFGNRVHLFHLPYAAFEEALQKLGWSQLNGVMLDLGISSLQLDCPQRGFGFRESGPLDMRMDASIGQSAKHLVNRWSFDELRNCIAVLGEEPQAGRIARHIMEERQKQPIETTDRLAAIIWHAYPAAWRKSARRHPATRTFQALRMAVNDELGQLKFFLDNIWQWLAPGARLAIISFHSLEDRMVKQAMRSWAANDSGAVNEYGKKMPGAVLINKKPLSPGEEELASNPRSRSAKLRVIEKLGANHDAKR